MEKYSQPADRYREQGNGAELARHLLDSFGLDNVDVEESLTVITMIQPQRSFACRRTTTQDTH
ncbi:hypothetical protein JCM19240_1033 [Vibrio maritimus]|uniref:Uncharacterized protein n=1 Tax=Vibrio maritimus TaxID=990268 RepID=A0A090T2B2_9VIBR|nr:hypothetical protein JCM19240_1033 [Vibrio maritimus]